MVVVQWWLDWVKWVRSEASGHASDTGVWCDPLAVGRMDSGQLSSCLSRPMQDAGSHGANKSEEVRVTPAEKFTALHFSELQYFIHLIGPSLFVLPHRQMLILRLPILKCTLLSFKSHVTSFIFICLNFSFSPFMSIISLYSFLHSKYLFSFAALACTH